MQSSGIELTRSSRNQVLRQCFAISRGSRMMSSAKLSAIIPSMHLQLLSIIVHIIIIIVVIIIIFSVIVIVIRIIVIVIISIVVVIISIIVVIITIIIYLCMYASICFSTLYKELHIIQARKRQKEKEKREMNRKWEGVERERKRERRKGRRQKVRKGHTVLCFNVDTGTKQTERLPFANWPLDVDFADSIA